MEIPNDIFFFQPPQEKLEEQERKGEDYLVDFHVGLLADTVNGIDGDIPDPELIDVQFDQDVIGHPVAFVNIVKLERTQGGKRNRRIACLSVGYMPVAGGDFG